MRARIAELEASSRRNRDHPGRRRRLGNRLPELLRLNRPRRIHPRPSLQRRNPGGSREAEPAAPFAYADGLGSTALRATARGLGLEVLHPGNTLRCKYISSSIIPR